MRQSRTIAVAFLLFVAGCAHQTQRVSTNGGELEYRVAGRGEPVLLIHGSIFADPFEAMIHSPKLRNYRLITYHRRGFAGSSRAHAPFTIEEQAADGLAVLDRLGVRRAHVVGHSYGGDIALQLAADHPERVASLVLLEPALFAPTPALQTMSTEIGAAAELHARGDDRAAIEKFLSAVVGSGIQASDQAVTDAPTFFDVELPAMQIWKFTIANAATIRMPTLLVAGSESREPFRETVAALRLVMPRSEDLTIPHVNHSMEIGWPDTVALAIAMFLQRHPMR